MIIIIIIHQKVFLILIKERFIETDLFIALCDLILFHVVV